MKFCGVLISLLMAVLFLAVGWASAETPEPPLVPISYDSAYNDCHAFYERRVLRTAALDATCACLAETWARRAGPLISRMHDYEMAHRRSQPERSPRPPEQLPFPHSKAGFIFAEAFWGSRVKPSADILFAMENRPVTEFENAYAGCLNKPGTPEDVKAFGFQDTKLAGQLWPETRPVSQAVLVDRAPRPPRTGSYRAGFARVLVQLDEAGRVVDSHIFREPGDDPERADREYHLNLDGVLLENPGQRTGRWDAMLIAHFPYTDWANAAAIIPRAVPLPPDRYDVDTLPAVKPVKVFDIVPLLSREGGVFEGGEGVFVAEISADGSVREAWLAKPVESYGRRNEQIKTRLEELMLYFVKKSTYPSAAPDGTLGPYTARIKVVFRME